MPTGPRNGPGKHRNLNGLPTPPASDEQPNRDTAYGGAELIDSYYNNDNGGDVSLDPPLPLLPSALNGAAPTPEGQPIERVANWARQNAGAFPPRTSLSRNTSGSENGARLPRNSPGMVMRSNTLGTTRSAGGFGESSRGDLDDGYESTVFSDREMSKVRVKLRCKTDTRGMVSVSSVAPRLAALLTFQLETCRASRPT